MTAANRRRLVRELVQVKERLRTHGIKVAYGPEAPPLREHIAGIKRRDEIERLLRAR